MINRNNAAGRLHRIFTAVSSHANDKSAYNMWGEVFGVADEGVSARYVAVANQLGLLHGEIQNVKAALVKGGVGESVYSGTLQKAEAASSPQNLHLQAAHVKQHLTPDTFVSLGFCSSIMDEEETAISEAELGQLEDLLAQLNKLLLESSAPAALQAMVAHHIGVIRSAILSYPIVGAAALKEAATRAVGELVVSSDLISDNADRPMVKKLGELWATVNRIADGALKTEKVAMLGARVVKALEFLA